MVGINDSTEPVTYVVNGKRVAYPSYVAWTGFLFRCYASTSYHPYHAGCTVHEDWHYYSNFKKWFDENYKEGYYLDKDMKVLGNKVYGPDTCVFMPAWLNSFLSPNLKSRGDYLIGVKKSKSAKKPFIAQIKYNGKKKFLGNFLTEEEAHETWKKFKLGILLEHKDFINSLSENLYDNFVIAVNTLK